LHINSARKKAKNDKNKLKKESLVPRVSATILQVTELNWRTNRLEIMPTQTEVLYHHFTQRSVKDICLNASKL